MISLEEKTIQRLKNAVLEDAAFFYVPFIVTLPPVQNSIVLGGIFTKKDEKVLQHHGLQLKDDTKL
ncbi:hypothetical protein [Pseudochrobactrum sp. HB0163]|uniref:hypothetical protein n=1 Tax=Pseudochrobactrum sp. HB0163 TaxID=3450708 RepID=UPI003F6DF337